MALRKKPNDYLIGELLAKQAERDCNLTPLLWAFARRDYSALGSEAVDSFTARMEELRYRIIQAYRSRALNQRILDDLPSCNQISYPIKLRDWGFISDHPTNARRALIILDAKQRVERGGPFPFLQLPSEIRQQVYSYMLAGRGRQVKIFGDESNHEYVPWKKTPIRSAKHLLPSSSPEFEYYNQGELEIEAAILRTCRQIHDEAEPTLYQLHDFDFGTNTPSLVSFLETVSDRARRNIRCIGMAFVAWSNVGGSLGQLMTQDRQNWSFACSYIAQHLQLRELIFDLDIPTQSSRFEQWDCIQDLLKIKDLRILTQRPVFGGIWRQSYRARTNGEVVTVRTREWMRSMDALLRFLVERMVRKDCTPQEKPSWQ